MQLQCLQLTTVGDREQNQDCMAHRITDNYGLFVVADGLGGHQGGEKASQYFCQSVFSLLPQFQPLMNKQPEVALHYWLEKAVIHMRALFEGDEFAAEAHTTCAILYIDKSRVLTAHCGDSRVYRVNRSQVLWRTRDHSIPQALYDNGEISETEMGTHPDQNQLMRSINIETQHPIEIRTYPPMEFDETFVLCTDGFWEHAKQQDFVALARQTLDKERLKQIAKLMMFRAGGKSDNITVQVVVRARPSLVDH